MERRPDCFLRCAHHVPYSVTAASVVAIISAVVAAYAVFAALAYAQEPLSELFAIHISWLTIVGYCFIGFCIYIAIHCLICFIFAILARRATYKRDYRTERCLLGGPCTAYLLLFLSNFYHLVWLLGFALLLIPLYLSAAALSTCAQLNVYAAASNTTTSVYPISPTPSFAPTTFTLTPSVNPTTVGSGQSPLASGNSSATNSNASLAVASNSSGSGVPATNRPLSNPSQPPGSSNTNPLFMNNSHAQSSFGTFELRQFGLFVSESKPVRTDSEWMKFCFVISSIFPLFIVAVIAAFLIVFSLSLIAGGLSTLHTRLRLTKGIAIFKDGDASGTASVDPNELEALVHAQMQEQLRLQQLAASQGTVLPMAPLSPALGALGSQNGLALQNNRGSVLEYTQPLLHPDSHETLSHTTVLVPGSLAGTIPMGQNHHSSAHFSQMGLGSATLAGSHSQVGGPGISHSHSQAQPVQMPMSPGAHAQGQGQGLVPSFSMTGNMSMTDPKALAANQNSFNSLAHPHRPSQPQSPPASMGMNMTMNVNGNGANLMHNPSMGTLKGIQGDMRASGGDNFGAPSQQKSAYQSAANLQAQLQAQQQLQMQQQQQNAAMAAMGQAGSNQNLLGSQMRLVGNPQLAAQMGSQQMLAQSSMGMVQMGNPNVHYSNPNPHLSGHYGVNMNLNQSQTQAAMQMQMQQYPHMQHQNSATGSQVRLAAQPQYPLPQNLLMHNSGNMAPPPYNGNNMLLDDESK